MSKARLNMSCETQNGWIQWLVISNYIFDNKLKMFSHMLTGLLHMEVFDKQNSKGSHHMLQTHIFIC